MNYDSMLSEDVIRAQRMAELDQMAKYRAKVMQQYKEWSAPENVATRLAEFKPGELVDLSKPIEIDHTPVMTFTTRPLYKPIVRLSWWRKLLNWLR